MGQLSKKLVSLALNFEDPSPLASHASPITVLIILLSGFENIVQSLQGCDETLLATSLRDSDCLSPSDLGICKSVSCPDEA